MDKIFAAQHGVLRNRHPVKVIEFHPGGTIRTNYGPLHKKTDER
jgi:hypothetical protein